jgi:hypothetical protein
MALGYMLPEQGGICAVTNMSATYINTSCQVEASTEKDEASSYLFTRRMGAAYVQF